MIPFMDLVRQHEAIKDELLAAVAGVLSSSRFVLGPEGQALEAELAARCGARHGIGVGSGTDALRLALTALGVGPGDEVVTPAFSFVASASTIVMTGATPVFADVDPVTLALNPDALERAITPRTRAVIVVHYAGVACEIDALPSIPIVEDNAHGLFGTYRGKPLGSLGKLATLSFHESKNITCGEGGALIVNDPALVERAEILRDKGTNRGRFFRGEVDKYTWVDLGSSFLPSDLLAGFLVAQLDAADTIQAQRQRVWKTYASELAAWAATHGIGLPTVPAHCAHPAHLFYLLLPDLAKRTALIAHLAARGIQALFHYQPLHRSEFAQRLGIRAQLPVTESVCDRVLRLPLYPELDEASQRRVIDAVTSFS